MSAMKLVRKARGCIYFGKAWPEICLSKLAASTIFYSADEVVQLLLEAGFAISA